MSENERLTAERDEARADRDIAESRRAQAFRDLIAERDEARGQGIERGRQLAYVELREERERFQADRDAALALLRDIKHEVEIGEDNAWARNLVDRINEPARE